MSSPGADFSHIFVSYSGVSQEDWDRIFPKSKVKKDGPPEGKAEVKEDGQHDN